MRKTPIKPLLFLAPFILIILIFLAYHHTNLDNITKDRATGDLPSEASSNDTLTNSIQQDPPSTAASATHSISDSPPSLPLPKDADGMTSTSVNIGGTKDSIAAIHGRAFDVTSGKGVAGVIVTAVPVLSSSKDISESPNLRAVTDEAGRFSYPENEYPPPVLFIYPPSGWVIEGEIGSVKVLTDTMADARQDISIRLKRGLVLTGKVVGQNGEPVRQATISAPTNVGSEDAFSDTNGTFSITLEKPGRTMVVARGQNGWAREVVDVPATGSADALTMKLQEYATISGKVTDSSGHPIAGAQLLSIEDTKFQTLENTGVYHRGPLTGVDGTFVLDQVMAGSVSLQLKLPPNSPFFPPTPQKIDVAPGESKENQNIIVGEGDVIEGVITSEDGRAIEGAEIAASLADENGFGFGPRKEVLSEKNGHYQIVGLSQNDVVAHLSASHPVYTAQSRSKITPMDGPQNFILKPARSFTMVVVEQDGTPVPHYDYIYAPPSLLEELFGFTHVDSPDGKTILKPKDEGDDVVSVAETNERGERTGRMGSASIPSSVDTDSAIKITLMNVYSVTGKVTDSITKAPISGAKVQLDTMLDGSSSTVADALGYFRFEKVAPNSYQLSAFAPNRAGSRPLQIAADVNNAEIDGSIEIKPAFKVFGKVTDAEGKPVPDAKLRLLSMPTSSSRSTATDADGIYSFENPVNAIGINLEAPGMNEMKTILVSATKDTEVNFDFSSSIKIMGMVTINGQPMKVGSAEISLTSRLQPSGEVKMVGDGEYECFAKAGNYDIIYNAEGINSLRGNAGTITILPLPREQTHDIEITIASADIIVDMGDGVAFLPGTVTITKAGLSLFKFERQMTFDLSNSRKHISAIFEGYYFATFTSNDGKINITSEQVKISQGAENVFYLHPQ